MLSLCRIFDALAPRVRHGATQEQQRELPSVASTQGGKHPPSFQPAQVVLGSLSDNPRLPRDAPRVNLHEQWISRIDYKIALGRKYLMPTWSACKGRRSA